MGWFDDIRKHRESQSSIHGAKVGKQVEVLSISTLSSTATEGGGGAESEVDEGGGEPDEVQRESNTLKMRRHLPC